jgi:flagellar motor switch protein FliM
VEELKYQEFVNSLPSSVILAVVNMPPLDGPTLLELSPDMCYAMIGRLLGGSSAVRVQSSLEHNRSYTEIELVLIERVLRQFTNLINEAWQKVIHVEASLDRIETNPMFAQIVSLNETVALITLNCKIGDTNGFINFCLPHLALEPINKRLTTKAWYQSSEAQQKSLPPATANISSRINTTRLPLTVVFNKTTSTTGDILGLQTDDVIVLDHHVDQPLTLMVGHLPKFHVEVGAQDKNYAAKIVAQIQEEDNNNG